MMSEKRSTARKPRSDAIPHLIAAMVLLLVANLIMAFVLVSRADCNLRDQLRKRMLDVANSAADMVDSDFIERMQFSDVGSPEYEQTLRTLRIFQDNIDLSYIYAVRELREGTCVIIVDPDPESPAPFGYQIERTEELVAALRGTPSMEAERHKDQWGEFYSAYSPIYNADGKIVGAIGVDYNASGYDRHVKAEIILILIVLCFSLVIGSILCAVIVHRTHKRYAVYDKELSALDEGFEKLNRSMMLSSVVKLHERPQATGNDLLKALAAGSLYDDDMPIRRTNEFTDIATRLEKMQDALGHYISYLDSQTFVDGLTGVGNKQAYKRFHEELDVEIEEGKAQFVVGFFDLNGLREINAKYTYEVGDTLLYAAASVLARIFHPKNVFHVAGDEFIVLLKGRTLMDMDIYFKRVDEDVERFNKLGRVPVKLSMSKGSAAFNAENDSNYRQVFMRAEENERREKAAYYAAHPKTES